MSEYVGEYVVSLTPKTFTDLRFHRHEEIVRCRDCRYYHPKEGAMLSCKFEYHGFTQWKLAEPDGFCAWGEREGDA